MPNHTTTPDIAKAPDKSQRMSRRQFNSYLHKLYGCPGNNDVTANYVYSGDEADNFYIEIFQNAPDGGTMIAIHHGSSLNAVDVFTVNDREVAAKAA